MAASHRASDCSSLSSPGAPPSALSRPNHIKQPYLLHFLWSHTISDACCFPLCFSSLLYHPVYPHHVCFFSSHHTLHPLASVFPVFASDVRQPCALKTWRDERGKEKKKERKKKRKKERSDFEEQRLSLTAFNKQEKKASSRLTNKYLQKTWIILTTPKQRKNPGHMRHNLLFLLTNQHLTQIGGSFLQNVT